LRPDPAARRLITSLLVIAGLALVLLPWFLRRNRLPVTSRPWQVTFQAAGSAPADSAAPDSGRIVRALASVPDPELGVSVVELGLIENVALTDSGRVKVTLVLTTPGCPYGADLARAALDAVLRVPGVSFAEVRIDPNAVWKPARVSDEVRRRLLLIPRP